MRRHGVQGELVVFGNVLDAQPVESCGACFISRRTIQRMCCVSRRVLIKPGEQLLGAGGNERLVGRDSDAKTGVSLALAVAFEVLAPEPSRESSPFGP